MILRHTELAEPSGLAANAGQMPSSRSKSWFRFESALCTHPMSATSKLSVAALLTTAGCCWAGGGELVDHPNVVKCHGYYPGGFIKSPGGGVVQKTILVVLSRVAALFLCRCVIMYTDGPFCSREDGVLTNGKRWAHVAHFLFNECLSHHLIRVYFWCSS
jgi:hypothetical protein